MLVVVLAVVMRGAGGDIVFGSAVETEDDAWIDDAIRHRQHRHRARRLRRYDRARGGQSSFAGEIGLRQQHDVGAGNLVLEHFRQRRFVVDAVISGALCGDRVEVGREPSGRHRLGIGQRDHAVDRDARADRGPVERLQQRFWQRQPRGLDQDVVGPLRHRHQRLDRRDEVVGHGAADAAIGELDDIFDRAIFVGAGFQNVAVNPERAELVDQNSKSLAAGVAHEMADQRGFSRTEKTGDHRNRYFGEVGHASTIGGMRARLCLRKIVGRSRQGTMPSGALA